MKAVVRGMRNEGALTLHGSWHTQRRARARRRQFVQLLAQPVRTFSATQRRQAQKQENVPSSELDQRLEVRLSTVNRGRTEGMTRTAFRC